ncbi:MAG: PD-(D/E)XK nuclease family protein [Chloroflexota bacterium]
MRPLSYTQISLYCQCPLCYKLQYIDGLEPRDKWQFSFGQTLHRALEYFFRVRVPPPPSLESLLAFYEANWLSAGYSSPEEEANYRSYGRELLSSFWAIHQPDFRMPLAVEHRFTIDVEGVKLQGVIDRVDKLDSGKLAIVDYKTNYKMFTRDDLASDLQLTFYQLAAEKLWFLPVERLTLYHLRSNTPCFCGARDKAQLELAKEIVLDTAEKISAGKFESVENAFCPCDFPEYCSYHRDRYAPAAEETRVPIKDAVERYVNLDSQIKELDLEKQELKDLIAAFCESQHLNRIFGDKHAITYRQIERTGFTEAEVKALLEPEGLWERVLAFDQSRLKELMEQETFPRALRQKLERLRQIASQYPQLWIKKLSEEE